LETGRYKLQTST